MQAFSAVKQTIKMDVDIHSRSEFVFNKWPWYWYTNEWRYPLWCGQCRIKNKCNTILLLRCRALFYLQSFTLCGNKNSVNKCDLWPGEPSAVGSQRRRQSSECFYSSDQNKKNVKNRECAGDAGVALWLVRSERDGERQKEVSHAKQLCGRMENWSRRNCCQWLILEWSFPDW